MLIVSVKVTYSNEKSFDGVRSIVQKILVAHTGPIELRRVLSDGFCNTCVVSSHGAVRASSVEGSVVVSVAKGFGVEICWSNLVTIELTRYVPIVFEWKESSVSVTANVNFLDIIAVCSGGNPTVLLSGLNNALPFLRTIC